MRDGHCSCSGTWWSYRETRNGPENGPENQILDIKRHIYCVLDRTAKLVRPLHAPGRGAWCRHVKPP